MSIQFALSSLSISPIRRQFLLTPLQCRFTFDRPRFHGDSAMRICLQRVQSAKVLVENETVGQIGPGLVLLVGFKQGDTDAAIAPIVRKIAELRIFEDEQGRMNLSLLDLGLSVLVVSQFTLYADTRKGRRPSFTDALEPVAAEKLYLRVIDAFQSMGVTVAAGRFGAKMLVTIHNWGPVTMVLDD